MADVNDVLAAHRATVIDLVVAAERLLVLLGVRVASMSR